MITRTARRNCGLALGILATWSPLCVGAEQEPFDLVATDAAAPAVIQLDSAPLASSIPAPVKVGQKEKISERYPNRTLKVERYVAQDDQGNFFNHGPWAKWDESGKLIGRGQFIAGAQSGKWIRFYSEEETAEAFATAISLGFEAPFTSTGEFADGKLDGMWIVLDAKKRQVSAAEFHDGRRHGKSVSWRPNGRKFRELEYQLGELDGKAVEYDKNEVAVKQEEFVQGFRHAVKVEHYPTGEVKSECETLFAKDVLEVNENWWKGTTEVKIIGKIGRDQRHGKFVAWNLEGLKILEGNYTDDKADGKFTWYHENGNKAIEGSFVAGKQDGPWTWWYSHGLKEISGEYVMGLEGGNWRSWEENGTVVSNMTILTGNKAEGTLKSTKEPTLAPPEPKTELKDADLELLPEEEDVDLESQPTPTQAPTPPTPTRRFIYKQETVPASSLKLSSPEDNGAKKPDAESKPAKPSGAQASKIETSTGEPADVKAAEAKPVFEKPGFVEKNLLGNEAPTPKKLEVADDLISIDALLKEAKEAAPK
ncbi:MAG: hypothetical protein K8U03_08345 [Planctomycetia bacterium]|nr:hypothetical protein [Planctomycetia bacterium]